MVFRDDRNVRERIVPECRFPIDQPQPVPVEQDVPGVRVIVGGHMGGRIPRVRGHDAFEAFPMGIEQTCCESGLEIRQHPPDQIPVVANRRKWARSVQLCDEPCKLA